MIGGSLSCGKLFILSSFFFFALGLPTWNFMHTKAIISGTGGALPLVHLNLIITDQPNILKTCKVVRSKCGKSNENALSLTLNLEKAQFTYPILNVHINNKNCCWFSFFYKRQNISENITCPNVIALSEFDLLLHTAGMSSAVLIFQRCDACCALMWFKAVVWHAAQHIWPIQYNVFFINYFTSVRVGGTLISLAGPQIRKFKYDSFTNIYIPTYGIVGWVLQN